MMTDRERRQRLDDIEVLLISLQHKRALLDDVASRPDTTEDRATLDLTIERLRRERELLQEPGQLMIWDRVNDLWKIVLDMQADTRELRIVMTRWLVALSVGMLAILAIELLRL